MFAFAVTRPKSVAVGFSCGFANCCRFSMFAASRARSAGSIAPSAGTCARCCCSAGASDRREAVDPQREEPLLKVCRHARRAPLEARVDVEPLIERRIVERDVVDIAIEEHVAELQQRARLPFERLARLPSAENLAPEAAVVEERPAPAERQLPDAVERDPMRPGVLARNPLRRRGVILVDDVEPFLGADAEYAALKLSPCENRRWNATSIACVRTLPSGNACAWRPLFPTLMWGKGRSSRFF